MLSYRLKCRKNKGNKNPKVAKTKNGTIMLLSKCAVCNSKNSKFLKEQEAKWLWDNCKHSSNLFIWWYTNSLIHILKYLMNVIKEEIKNSK